MSLHGYELQSDWAKKYAEEGRKDGLEEGRKEGRKEGLREGQTKLLIKQLTLKFKELPDAILQRIREADSASLERWAERLLVEQTLDAVFAG